ncbi:XNIF protein, partial [Atractosteus spatula]|nr:XNIF protein [Atractosteus spatula]
MSYSTDIYSTSSYRKIFGDAPRVSARVSVSSSPSRASVYRSGPALHSRNYGSSSGVSSSTYRKIGTGRAAYSALPESFELSQSTAVTNELKIIRTNEKEQLQGLNDRFVTFIERVHQLEQQNKVLEAEVTLLRQRQSEPSRLHELYEQEIRELRARVEELTHEKSQMHLDCVQMSEGLERVKDRLGEETRLREEAEGTLKGYRKDVDDATLARLELEKKVESLLDEIAFLRKVHEEEVQELQTSMQASQVSVEMDVSKPDLALALRDIRAQYESLSAKNQQLAEDWYKSKFASVKEAAARNSDAVKQTKEELSEYRRQMQARTLEIEALRSHNEALERQLQELEDRHAAETSELQEVIQQLENALRNTKGEMSRHLREYQDLLLSSFCSCVSSSSQCRKLLEGEETRLSSVGGALLQSGYPGLVSSSLYSAARSYTMSSSTLYRRMGAKLEEPEEEEKEEEEEEEEEAENGEKEEEEEEEGGEEEEEEKEEKKELSVAPTSKS